MKNRKAYISALIEVMSTDDALRGIHIDMIAQRLVMCGMPVVSGQSFDDLKMIANKLILSDCRRSGGTFEKVVNVRTGRARRGVYRLIKSNSNER